MKGLREAGKCMYNIHSSGKGHAVKQGRVHSSLVTVVGSMV